MEPVIPPAPFFLIFLSSSFGCVQQDLLLYERVRQEKRSVKLERLCVQTFLFYSDYLLLLLISFFFSRLTSDHIRTSSLQKTFSRVWPYTRYIFPWLVTTFQRGSWSSLFLLYVCFSFFSSARRYMCRVPIRWGLDFVSLYFGFTLTLFGCCSSLAILLMSARLWCFLFFVFFFCFVFLRKKVESSQWNKNEATGMMITQ